MEVLSFINIGGTIAFVASGALAGLRKKLDIFGVIVIAFVTAIGGGTIRDLLIGINPVKWIADSSIITLIVAVALVTIFLRRHIIKLDKTLLLFDTLGLGFFTIKGIEEAINAGLSIQSCIVLGTITACFGGVLRDILLNEIPVIFSKEIYATVCIVGGMVYFLLLHFQVSVSITQLVTFIVIVIFRFLAILFNFSFPKIES